jgi:hypothetical protein
MVRGHTALGRAGVLSAALVAATVVSAVVVMGASARVGLVGQKTAAGRAGKLDAGVPTTPIPRLPAAPATGTVFLTSGSADLSIGGDRDPRHPSVHEVPASLSLPAGSYYLLARVSYRSSQTEISTGDCALDVTYNQDVENTNPIDQFFNAPIGGSSGFSEALTPDEVQGNYVLQGIAQLSRPGYARVECLQIFQAPPGVVLATLSAIQGATIIQQVTHG